MAQTTPNLGLTVWNLKTDPYDSGQLAQNFIAIDQHDHSGNGKGSPIDATNAILNGSITGAKLASPAVGTGNIADYAITSTKLSPSSVTTEAILDGAVKTNEIDTGAVTETKIADSNVSVGKLKAIPACEINNTTSQQSITGTTSVTWVVADLTATNYDTVAESGVSSTAMADITNNRIYARKNGFYMVTFITEWNHTAIGMRMAALWAYNSSNTVISRVAESALPPTATYISSPIIRQSISGIQYLTSGQYVAGLVSSDVSLGINNSKLKMIWLGSGTGAA